MSFNIANEQVVTTDIRKRALRMSKSLDEMPMKY
jgi:hypothetical protein